MPRPNENSKPQLAPGCRWAEPNGAERMLMFPEGALRLQGTGRDILERCDGQRMVRQIVQELQQKYGAMDPDRIREEVGAFLDKLHQKRIVDFEVT